MPAYSYRCPNCGSCHTSDQSEAHEPAPGEATT